jgi:hypothetical protein
MPNKWMKKTVVCNNLDHFLQSESLFKPRGQTQGQLSRQTVMSF